MAASEQRRSFGRPSMAAPPGYGYPPPWYPPPVPYQNGPMRVTVYLKGTEHDSEQVPGVTMEVPTTFEEFETDIRYHLGLAPGTAIRIVNQRTFGQIRTLGAIRDDEMCDIYIDTAGGMRPPPPRTGGSQAGPSRGRSEVPTTGAPNRYMAQPPPRGSAYPSSSVQATPAIRADEPRNPFVATTHAPTPLNAPQAAAQAPAADDCVFDDAGQDNAGPANDTRDTRGGSPTLTPPREIRSEPKKKPVPPRPLEKHVVRVVVRRHKDRVTFRIPVNKPLKEKLVPVLPKFFSDVKNTNDVQLLIRDRENEYRQLILGASPADLRWNVKGEVHLVLALPK